ncbi:AAA family ATPase [Dapis sp. BLCC M126]|uniref:AAA family ATPase n=1 Tax=Dapis sp. BLCC M126 TaxID=3400189 RepID=UPI003CF2DA6A
MNYANNNNYQIIGKIYESANSLVYQGILTADSQPIIIKILKENYPTPSELTRYKQEYEITRSLSHVDSIVKVYDLQRYKNSLVMLLEDFGGQSLKSLLSQSQLSLEEFLTIAIKITESLAIIHTNNIIHKDINSSNIIYNPQTGQLKIIDFGISTRLSQEFMTVIPPHQLEGTLAYIAPEQTGRMNRGIDYRSDFYSVGVTFYELLTNKLPFETTDPIELVHCHIAQQPLPPHELNYNIPLAVSNIVIKLLAKAPEERYQNALGIQADLETCLHQLKSLGKISQFALGSQDIAEKFHIPQKLYGREQEVAQLLTTFEKVTQGTREMILISGYSGIGKSALVNEIHKPITRQRGQFISGKFDQFQRDIPYSAISQAFQDLIRKLLSEPEIILQIWKNKILEALGNNGQIIIDVIPEVAKIIGQQPPVEQLGRTESQNRFNLFFHRFMEVFCQKEHPLVIFIDDLQWADLPSLNLIEQLMSDSDNQYLLMIGAYRDNEVSSTHPLVNTLEKIKQAKVLVNEITLYPLKLTHINHLIADTLSCSSEVVKPLAELVSKKTGGNPFFLTQLLYSLYQENLVVFQPPQSFLNAEDNQKCYWQWDIDHIERVSITDNVVELMVSKIEKLELKTQNILKLAACIGNQFNLEILAIINGKSQTITAQELEYAIQEGLINPLDNNYKISLLWDAEELSNQLSENYFELAKYIPYKFLHDRVQQAAYSLISEAEKKQVHLQIGRLLLRNIAEYELQNKIFDIVNQLNQGLTLITEQLERDELAKLNLQAGKKAKDSTAYEPARIYLETALELLSPDSWKTQSNLTLEIYTETVEVEYLNTRFDRAEALSSIVLQNTKEILYTIKIYELKIQSYYAQLQLQEAIDTALEILSKLGIVISSDISLMQEKVAQEQEYIKSLLRDKSIAELAELPTMTDPEKLAAVRLLMSIATSAIICNPQLYPLVTLTTVSLCIKYGNSPLAASAYVFYGLFLCGGMQDIDTGYEYGKLSLGLLNKYDTDEAKPFVIHHYYGFIRHWKEPFKKISLRDFEDTIQIAMELGDLGKVGYNVISHSLLSIFRGWNLEDIKPKFEAYSNLILKLQQEYEFYYYEACKKMALSLLQEHRDNNYLLFKKSQSEEENLIQSWIDADTQWLLFIYCLSKTFTCYFFKDYHIGLETAYLSEKYGESVSAYLIYPQNIFYSALTLLAAYPQVDSEQKKIILEKVAQYQTKIFSFQENCPENYGNKYDLVAAEKARVLGENWQAQELYEKAIQGAKKHEFIHEEALAYERAAEFYLALDREEIGQLYLRNAHHCYSRWGATAKVKQLESEYPQYFLGVTDRSQSKGISTTISTTGSSGEILDLATVIKASQAISGEIKLENLLHNLMKILIENAGAQTGFLILNHKGSWVIEGKGTINSDEVTILQSIPIEFVDPETSIPILPTTIINYVIRSQENIVLNDATHQGQFIDDPYIIAKQSKSILCTPLINQGKLSGIIYLENNLTTSAFTSKRVELLNILSVQAAISIDNSRLYAQVRENESRLAQFLNAMPVGVAILDASCSPYYLNQVGEELLGKGLTSNITAEQIPSIYQLYKTSTGEIYPSEDLTLIRVLQGESLSTDDVEVRQDNKVIPLESFSTPIYDEQGKITYAICAFLDITERKKAEADRQRFTNELFQLNKAYERFVPKQFLEFLDKESIVDVELGDQVQLEMSVLFSDVRNFTTMSEAMTPDENFRFINSFLSRMEPAILENQGFIDKYIGDAIMALFSGDADNAVKAGISMLKRLNKYNQERINSGEPPIGIGVGINTGLLMLGTVGGQNRMDGSVISDAVNLAARVESLTKNYGVSLLITEQTFSRLTQPSNYAIRSIDTVKVKGKSQKVTIYEVFDTDMPEVKEGKLKTLEQFTQAIFLYKSGRSLEARQLFAECLKVNPSDVVAKIYLERLFIP